MGHYTVITITEAAGLTEELIEEAAGRHMQGELSEPAIDERAGAEWHVSGSTRWTPEGVEDFAEAISARFPSASIDVRIEWDTQDADEAGTNEYSYLGGRRCNERESGLVPRDLDDSIKRIRDALTGGGDLAAAALWLVDGLEGTRTPLVQPAPPRTVASVTVTDQWGHDYSDLFVEAFEYSEVSERSGDELLTATGWHDDRRLAAEADVSPIVHRWIGHAENETTAVYSSEWMGGWDAYVIPFWDGTHVGFRFIEGNGDGDGSIPFDRLIENLDLSFVVTWSDGTTE